MNMSKNWKKVSDTMQLQETQDKEDTGLAGVTRKIKEWAKTPWLPE